MDNSLIVVVWLLSGTLEYCQVHFFESIKFAHNKLKLKNNLLSTNQILEKMFPFLVVVFMCHTQKAFVSN